MIENSTMNTRISAMKLLCAFMVVVIHSQFYTEGGSWLKEFLMYGLCRIAVPFFFVVSGYFLAKHMSENGWWLRELGKRIRGLVIPYLIFAIGFMLLSYSIEWIRHIGDIDVIRVVKDIGADPRVTPLLAPLWYVRALFVLVVISPFIKLIVGRDSKKASLFGLFCIALICFMIRPYSDCSNGSLYLFFNYGLSLEGLLYFSVGIYFANHPLRNIPGFFSGMLLLVIGVVLFVLRTYCLLYTKCQIGYFAIPCLLAGLFLVMPRRSLPAWMNNASFPVYMCHFYIIALLGGRISRGGGGWFEPDASLLHWLLRIVVAFFGSIIIAAMLSRFCPRVSVFIFGGRLSTRKY